MSRFDHRGVSNMDSFFILGQIMVGVLIVRWALKLAKGGQEPS